MSQEQFIHTQFIRQQDYNPNALVYYKFPSQIQNNTQDFCYVYMAQRTRYIRTQDVLHIRFFLRNWRGLGPYRNVLHIRWQRSDAGLFHGRPEFRIRARACGAIYEAKEVKPPASAPPPARRNRETAQSVAKSPDERYLSAPPMTGILALMSSLLT